MIDDEFAVGTINIPGKAAVNGIVLKQVCQSSGSGQIIDGHNFNTWPLQQSPEAHPPDAAKPIDSDIHIKIDQGSKLSEIRRIAAFPEPESCLSV